ncbi:MAG: ATPase [Gammaproteobacteria bacterium]|nr:MAG: ATPase [Gammaproteobacteria bacterium]
MYNEHFGLERAPFRITPDTKLFYPGGARGEILEALMYAVSSGEGIVKLVGEVGSGKTMLCRMLEERLADKVDIVYLANPSLSPEDTLHAIALEMKLDVDPGANRLQVMHALQERLLEKHADNRQVVVFVEEAQSMPIATLEEIRLLSNLETNRDKLLQIVLFGQPELDDNLDKPEIRQLKERITHSFYLQPFTPEQMREYVNFRMRAVGYRGPDIFRAGAYRRMARASGGLTRRINILADKALLAAFAEDAFDVGKRHVKIAVNDSQFVRIRRWGLPEFSLISGLVLIVAAVSWTFAQRSDAVSERLGQWLPGGATQTMPQPAANQEQSGDQANAVAMPESAPTNRQAVLAADASSSAVADDRPLASVAAGSGVIARTTGATDGQSREQDGGSGTQAQAASAPPPMPIAMGGSRLVLSDSLSQPPPSDARMIEQTSTDAPDAIAPAAGAGEPSSAGLAPLPERAAEPVAVAVVAPSSDQEAIDQETVETIASPVEESSLPVGEALGPLTEARLVATRDWLQAANDQHFSIQLLLTDFARRANLEKFLRERQSAGEVEDYFVFETRIRSNIWYGVLYKEYPSFAAAKAALEELPEEFRYHQPFIRNVRDIATLG